METHEKIKLTLFLTCISKTYINTLQAKTKFKATINGDQSYSYQNWMLYFISLLLYKGLLNLHLQANPPCFEKSIF